MNQFKTPEIQRKKNAQRMRERRARMDPQQLAAENRKYYERRTEKRAEEIKAYYHNKYHNMTPVEKYEVSEKRRKYYQQNRETILARQNAYNKLKREQKAAQK